MSRSRQRYRNAMLTLFEQSPGDGILPTGRDDWPDFVSYAIWQHERCPSSGRLHAQCYAEFSRQVDLSQLQNWWSGCHVERRHGSAEQASNYCSKSDTRVAGPWKFGTQRKQGLRTDLNEIHEYIKEGAGMQDIVDNYFNSFVRYRGGIESAYRLYNAAPTRTRPEVWWYWGESGTGKSRTAWHKWPDAFLYEDNKDGWFGYYDRQKTIILDDFSGCTPLRKMLRLVDYHPCTMPSKGLRGGCAIHATRFIFTANMTPDQCYPYPIGTPFTRRIQEFGTILHFPEEAPEIDWNAVQPVIEISSDTEVD